jgi:hypothetical protein
VNRKDFQKLAKLRISEANVLLNKRRYAGAYYLAGYAVECALKACIAKRTKLHDFPPDPKLVNSMYVHNLNALLKPAGLATDHQAEMGVNRNFAANWAITIKWSERSRYDPVVRATDANEIYNAISDPQDGVLQWVQRFW